MMIMKRVKPLEITIRKNIVNISIAHNEENVKSKASYRISKRQLKFLGTHYEERAFALFEAPSC